MLYDELCIICGDDDASGSFARDTGDSAHLETGEYEVGGDDFIEVDAGNNDTPVTDSHYMDTTSGAEPSQSSASAKRKGKRRAANVEVMEKLVERVGEVANSILRLKEDTVDRALLFQLLLDQQAEINMSDDQVSTVYDYLVENDKIALGFISRPNAYRKSWLVKYFMERTSRHPQI
jgi:hypothetical protein